jgi:NAD(P)-dependent dehydrogenase (short-subunit alcohol dehydrogenase family)
MTHIRFTPEDLELFSRASHDRNPLHLSDEYARRTPYGGRVVFGVLDGLTAMGSIRDRPGQVLSSVEFEFFDTALLGIDYSLQIRENDDTDIALQVTDGRRPVLEAVLGFTAGKAGSWIPGTSQANAIQPRELTGTDLPVGHHVEGKYGPPDSELMELCAKFGLNKSWLGPQHIAALMWSSYLIGMELPGKRALFSRLRIEFEDFPRVSSPFDYRAEITEVSLVGELSIEGNLSCGRETWARAELAAHVREDVPPITVASVEKFVGRSESLKGKTALVTGASRGLGSALVYAFVLHGCAVILNFARNRTLAQQIRDSIGSSGTVELEQGDARNPEWCRGAAERIATQFGRLDFLVCNASPPLLPLWLEPDAARRVNEFIQSSVAMVSSPVMAFLPQIAASKGWNVLISSVAATQPHPHFPHYAAAKCAAEALVRSAATEYRSVSSLIVRPARLLTDLTNTPLGRKGSMAPELVAASIVNRLRRDSAPGKVELLEQFESMNQGNG